MKQGRYGRYELRARITVTEEEARTICAELNALSTPYMRKHNPARVEPYKTKDGSGNWIVWYWI